MEESQNVPESQEQREESETSPKTPQSVLDKCRFDYEMGNWKSLRELAERYSINPKTLQGRIVREKWEESRKAKLSALESKLDETKEVLVRNYLEGTFKRARRYEKLIDSAQKKLNLGVDDEGLPVIPPDTLNTYTLMEARIHELCRKTLGIADPTQSVDVTSKGQSIGESLLSAIQKVRENPEKYQLSKEEEQRIIEAEIIDEDQ